MLDLLLLRAEQAQEKLLQHAECLPGELELRRIKLSDEFIEMLMDVILCIARDDGEATLVTRRADIAHFGELFASVIWHLSSKAAMKQHILEHLYCARCWQHLRERSKNEPYN